MGVNKCWHFYFWVERFHVDFIVYRNSLKIGFKMCFIWKVLRWRWVFGKKWRCRRREITVMWWAQTTAWHPEHHRHQIKHQIDFLPVSGYMCHFSRAAMKRRLVCGKQCLTLCAMFFSLWISFLSLSLWSCQALQTRACGVSHWQTGASWWALETVKKNK